MFYANLIISKYILLLAETQLVKDSFPHQIQSWYMLFDQVLHHHRSPQTISIGKREEFEFSCVPVYLHAFSFIMEYAYLPWVHDFT